MANDLIM